MKKQKVVALLKQALALLEEPEPESPLEGIIQRKFRGSSTHWMDNQSIFEILEYELKEPLEPTDPIRIGKIMRKLKFKKEVRKLNNKSVNGYYVQIRQG